MNKEKNKENRIKEKNKSEKLERKVNEDSVDSFIRKINSFLYFLNQNGFYDEIDTIYDYLERIPNKQSVNKDEILDFIPTMFDVYNKIKQYHLVNNTNIRAEYITKPKYDNIQFNFIIELKKDYEKTKEKERFVLDFDYLFFKK